MSSGHDVLPSGNFQRIRFVVRNVESYFHGAQYPLLRSRSLTCGRFRFRLLVYPAGTSSTKGKFLSAFIEADPQEGLVSEWEFPKVKYSITLVNHRCEEFNITKHDTFTFSRDTIDRGWHDLCARSWLMDSGAGWAGPNNTVVIYGSASVDMTEETWKAMLSPEAKARSSLASDMSTLWISGWQSDVTLQAHGQELKAHSLILASRSPVFKQMLNSGMAESTTKIVNIPDTTPEVLNHLCGFMYSGEVQECVWEDDDMICGLLRAACKYDVLTLAELCAVKAQERVLVDNVAEWLIVAAELNVETLKTYCVSFVAEDLSNVQVTQGWERLMQNKQLVFELAPLLFKTISPPPTKKAKPSSSRDHIM